MSLLPPPPRGARPQATEWVSGTREQFERVGGFSLQADALVSPRTAKVAHMDIGCVQKK